METTGSFHSPSFQVSFGAGSKSDKPPPWADAIATVDTGTIAHELVHAMHALSSAAGIRSFALALAEDRLRGPAVGRAMAAGRDGVLDAPFMFDIFADTDSGFRAQPPATLAELRKLRLLSERYRGGAMMSTSTHVGIHHSAPHVALSPTVFTWPTRFYDLTATGAPGEAVQIGYSHLTEGIADIAETALRRGEAGDGSWQDADLVPVVEMPRRWRSPVDPYHVADLYVNDVATESRVDLDVRQRFGNQIFTWILADIALMLDPLVTPQGFSRVFAEELSLYGDDRAVYEYTPGLAFDKVCRAFWHLAVDLPLFDPRTPHTEQYAEYQRRVLDCLAPGLTMIDLIEEAIHFAEAHKDWFGGLYQGHAPAIATFLEKAPVAALTTRRDGQAGTGYLTPLLHSRRTVVEMLESWCPIIVIGGGAYMRDSLSNGTDQLWVAALPFFNELTENLVAGNSSCSFTGVVSGIRECPLPHRELCDRVPDRLPRVSDPWHCMREYGLHVLAENEVREIRWFG